MKRLLFSLSLVLLGCESGGGSVSPMLDGGSDAPLHTGPTHLTRIESVEEYESLVGEGREVKYLTRVDGAEPIVDETTCLFQNTRRFPYHIQFLRTVFPELATLDFDAYVSMVLRARTRRGWGGSLRPFDNVAHPISRQSGIYAFFVYQETGAGERLSVAQLTELDRRLKECAPALASKLVLVPSTAEQEASIVAIRDELMTANVAVLLQAELIEDEYEVYSAFENYGHLHVVDEGEELGLDYGPRDVVVVSAAPTDISIVAGLVTALPQNVHSHVNLRMREKQAPNAMLASIYDDPRIESLRDQLVHIVANESGLVLEAASLEDAERFWEMHRPNVGEVSSELSVTTLEGLDTLRHADAIAFGVKAANLGELHAILPAENRVEGFGIPFSAYRDYVQQNGIDADVRALLADPRVRTDREYRDDQLDDLRDAVRDGAIDPAFWDRLVARVREVYGPTVESTYLRFRSSTNAEDLEGLSGAGLYDSNTGCLGDDLDSDELGPSRCLSDAHRAYLEAEIESRREEQRSHPERTWLADILEDLEGDLTEEKPMRNAIRKVWRSLWNLRAFDEREYYGIPHDQVFMGIAVQPTFVMEKREAVAVTNLRVDEGAPVYRLVSQVREVGVVRPSDPSAVAETLTFRRAAEGASDVRLIVPSSLSPGGARLWSDAEIATVSSLLFSIQDHFAADVYPEIENLRLDLEIEVTSDDRIVIKQARPYIGP